MFLVIEAKYQIRNDIEYAKAKTQLKSYSRLLKSNYSALITKDFIHIFNQKDDYNDLILNYTWKELDTKRNFEKVNKLIGNKSL